MTTTYREIWEGPKGDQHLTGCEVTTTHSDGCTTVETREAQQTFFGGVEHGAVIDRVTYGPSHKA